MTEDESFDPAWQARCLLRAARSGTLATAAGGGQPFASLVTPACAPGGAPLLLLSDLSEHTRHLRADPRCALLVAGPPDGPNPQTTPRLTVTGTAALENDPGLRARWVSLHPYAAFYAGFGDFRLWRIEVGGALLVGGFAQAVRVRAEALMPCRDAVDAVTAAAADIIAHCNADHAGALAELALDQGANPAPWRMVAVDVDGCDLAAGETVRRVAWPGQVSDANGVRRALIARLDEFRAARHSAAGQ